MTSIILIKLIRVSLGTVRHPRRFKIVVIDIQITLKQMLRDFIGIRVNRAKKSGMVNITSSVIFRFQAEDGIRDSSVTGVQTCALPICHDPYPTVICISLMPKRLAQKMLEDEG